MSTVYSEYSRDKIGWFLGLRGWQIATLTAAALPVLGAVGARQWLAFLGLLLAWTLVALLVVIPVHGRSATGWLAASVAYAAGTLLRWTSFRSRAATGRIDDLTEPDLPGVVQSLEIHDGPAHGPMMRRVALIQDHGARTWAVTATLLHPGLHTADPAERASQGRGLAELLDSCSRGELVDEVLFVVRTVPDDGAERQQYIAQHRRPASPTVVRTVNDDLSASLTQASVRTEQFVTIVVPEARLAREARECGGGLDGRARALYLVMAEVETHLKAAMGVKAVTWLTSQELAVAVRTGFAPGDRASIIDALAAADHGVPVNAEVPWAMAGPSGADLVARHYSHDAWNSASSTIKLPAKGAVMGALAPILAPQAPGERRSLVVCFPVTRQSTADRQSQNAEWGADMGQGLREKLGMKERARNRADVARVRNMDAKLARGNSMTRPYAVCTVTVPKTQRIAEFARRLDAAVRRAGFAPMRLDLVQDAAFVASTIPLGASLLRKAE